MNRTTPSISGSRWKNILRGNLKLSEMGKKELELKNYWQWTKHSRLYSDLLQASKDRSFDYFAFTAEKERVGTEGGGLISQCFSDTM